MLLIYYEYIVARNVRNRCFTRADKSRVEDIPTGIIVVRNNNIINDMVEGAHIEGNNMTSRTPRRCFVLVQFLQTMLGFELATPQGVVPSTKLYRLSKPRAQSCIAELQHTLSFP